MKPEKDSVIDLFAGCGGFSLGMQNAGFDVVVAIDKDPFAVEAYKANFPSHTHILERDVQNFSPAQIAKLIPGKTVDVIIGGPPCQGFSVARKVDGSNHGVHAIKDGRRRLFQHFLRSVKHFRPQVFVMENVRGIRTAEGSRIFHEILRRGNEIGYNVNETLLKAWQFGVPQKRIRQIFLGVRKDMPIFSIDDWIRPTHADPEQSGQNKLDESATLWEAIGGLPCLKPGEEKTLYDHKRHQTQIQKYGGRYVEDILQVNTSAELTSHTSRFHSDRDLRDFKKLREGETSAQAMRRGVKMEFPYSRAVFKDRYTRQHRNRLSSTIVAHLSKDGLMFIHPTQNRSLTPREAARIQSFPDWFKFPVARTHQYRLIGNAVPPLLGQSIGQAIKEYLKWANRVSLPRTVGE